MTPPQAQGPQQQQAGPGSPLGSPRSAMKLLGMFTAWKETPYATVKKMIMAVADAMHTNNPNAPRCCALHRGAFLMGWRGLEMLAKEECSTEPAIIAEGWQCGFCHAVNPPSNAGAGSGGFGDEDDEDDEDELPACMSCHGDMMCHGVVSLARHQTQSVPGIPTILGCEICKKRIRQRVEKRLIHEDPDLSLGEPSGPSPGGADESRSAHQDARPGPPLEPNNDRRKAAGIVAGTQHTRIQL